MKFCLFLLVFEWSWFFIAWFGIRRFGKVSFAQLVGGSWNRASKIILDVGIAVGVLIVLLLLGTLMQQFLSRFESSAAPLRSMVPQNVSEASAFLATALTAGFVEEFVFRGYLQRQLTAWHFDEKRPTFPSAGVQRVDPSHSRFPHFLASLIANDEQSMALLPAFDQNPSHCIGDSAQHVSRIVQ